MMRLITGDEDIAEVEEPRIIMGPDGHPLGEPRTLLLPRSVEVLPPEGCIFAHDPDRPTHQHFAIYADWRTTKCRPRNMDDPEEYLDEINQAIHEFVGEVGELGELLYRESVEALYIQTSRAKLIDEVGDIFFCGSWLLDAMGPNPLRDPEAPSPDTLLAEDRLALSRQIADRLKTVGESPLTEDESSLIFTGVASLSWQMCYHAALLCNSYKKARYQKRQQSLEDQINRVMCVFLMGAHLLAMAGANVTDALARNIEKLDHRYPRGYVGPGGGNREGKGA